MSHSLVKQPNHIVFGTKGRRGLITAHLRDEVHAYIGGILRSEKCRLIKAGGMLDWIRIRFPHRRTFTWQNGYGAFSESYSRFPFLKAYIENQEARHRKVSIKDELRQLA